MKKEQLKKEPAIKIYPIKNNQQKRKINKRRYYDLIGLVIIILLGIIIYSNSFNCSFHFDDVRNIVENTKIHNLSDFKSWWGYSPTRPVSIFTYAVNYHFNKLDVRYYHLVNLIIHLINALLVWWLTRLIFSSPALKDQRIVRHKNLIAFFTALLFVSHPLATQAVTYIVQRATSLAALFYLLSLSLYVKARLTGKGNALTYLLFASSLISAILAMLTKEFPFTLPVAIALFELYFLRTKKISIKFTDYRVILLLAAFLGILIIIPLKVPVNVFKPIPPSLDHPFTLTPLNYLLTQFSVIIKYIQLLILPVNQNVYYDFPLSNHFFEVRTLLSFLVLSSLIILAVFLFKKQRIISFGILWFFLTLSIESGFLPIHDLINEHRTYLPSFGFFLILCTILFLISGEKHKITIVILTVITVSYSFLTYQRNKIWKDNITLWSDVIEKSPGLALPYSNRGIAYANIGQWDKTISDCSMAIRFSPGYPDAYYNRGSAFGNLDQLDKAIADYSMVIRLDPWYIKARYNRGVAYSKLGQWDKAVTDFNSMIAIDTTISNAYSGRGFSYSNLGQLDKAIADFTTAVRINPGNADAYSNRSVVYAKLRQWQKTINDCNTVIGIDPEYARAYFNRGVAYRNLQQLDKAIADYSAAIAIDPGFADAWYNRGNTYGMLREWDKAFADFSRVIEIDPAFKDADAKRELVKRNIRR